MQKSVAVKNIGIDIDIADIWLRNIGDIDIIIIIINRLV